MTKSERQHQIVELLARNEIDSQDQLLALLAVEGLVVTQSTLSRDLRELGIVKTPEGYRVAPGGSSRNAPLSELARSIAIDVEGADHGGQVVVLRLREGADSKNVARRIEQAELFQLVAAMAADDRVLVVARSPVYAKEWVRALREGKPRRSPLEWMRRD